RCRAAGIPDEVPFATKNEHFRWMLQRAIDAGGPFAWVTADEAYGQVKYLRVWLEQRGVGYVLATRVNDTVITSGWREVRVDGLVAALPRHAWKRLSGGPGSHGERVYDWARVAIRPVWEDGAGHWVLARRSVKDPTDIAHYVCYGPVATRLKDLVKVAAARWAIEESFQVAKNECGLDQYEVRRYPGWYRHITLAMLAHAFLAAMAAAAAKRGQQKRFRRAGPAHRRGRNTAAPGI
ncbi:IS701 family transposase, partial [Streptomyces sp. NPDC000927]|uniref:IS701 family transposase n=1 Tax=Streptomyces sp. NPDC000927 TaxID=3154371 RepID=UPI00331E7E93